jgi:hypothetical protein
MKQSVQQVKQQESNSSIIHIATEKPSRRLLPFAAGQHGAAVRSDLPNTLFERDTKADTDRMVLGRNALKTIAGLPTVRLGLPTEVIASKPIQSRRRERCVGLKNTKKAPRLRCFRSVF